MKRRGFLEGVGIAAAGSLMLSDSADARPVPQRTEFAKGPTEHPLDTRIAVKPVFAPIFHSAVWEGPCRPTAGNRPKPPDFRTDPAAWWSIAAFGKTPEQEKADAQEGIKKLSDNLKANLNSHVRLLEPVMMDCSEDFWYGPKQMAKFDPDRDEVDIYLVSGVGYAATVIAEAFKKPVVAIAPGFPALGPVFIGADAVAGLKRKGLEGYAVFDFQELNHVLSLLRARKVFQQTSILIITDRGLPPIPIQSCMDVNMLKDKFGIESHFVSYREFSSEMDAILKSKEWGAKAEDRAEQLIKSAAETHIDKRYVKRSLEFYYAVRNLMHKYGCNAFTVECFELCGSRLADRYQITPCLVHTLLKDEGHASACEADLNALLTMRLLMSVANKSSFMGNPMPFSKDELVINHSVPGIKMAGYDQPDLPYHLRHFVESGWGTKVMIDFMQPEEKTVTLARLDPLGTKIFVAKGDVVRCSGFIKGTLLGCSLAAHVKVPDSRGVLRTLSGFGSHLSMVYGDYTREINELADMMGLEVVYAT